MFGKKENLIGLDIGSHTAKAVQLEANNAGLKLLTCGIIPVPREAFAEGRVSKSELVAKSIQQLSAHLKLKDKFVAAAISGYEVMIKKIELPMMTEDELHNRMRMELGQYIPYNVEEVDVDYQIMDVAKDRPSNMEVLLVASKKESISDHVNLIRLAGFEPAVVDVDFFALSNAYEATYGLGDDSVALVDIGANKAIMNIVARGIPVFTRGISIGGTQITDRIRDRFKVSEDDAERIKMNQIPSGISAKEVGDIFVSAVRNWVSEFKRAVDFYYSNFPDKQIKQVYLSGGSCRIPGLDKVFEETINAKVGIFNPLSRLEYDSKAFDSAYIDYVGPQMAISLGLALRKTKEK
jgi:type IV pilus assembly protein PilM